MPGVLLDSDATRKRKRANDAGSKSAETKPRKAPKSSKTADSATEILVLESKIHESPDHYDNLSRLQKHVDAVDKRPEEATLAAVSLCRTFCRLIAGENLVKRHNASEKEIAPVQTLKASLRDYVHSLATWLGSPDAAQESTALTLLMRIVREEVSQEARRADQAWRTPQAVFTVTLRALLENTEAEGARQEFADKFVEEKDDVRFYTFLGIKQYFEDASNRQKDRLSNALDLLSRIEGIPESADQLDDWYGAEPDTKKHILRSLSAHHKMAQEAWLAMFRSPLTNDHRKKILAIMTRQILPWFASKLEILTDFLTDSFNSGGSTALLALNGLFNLMTKKNIDYPDFYTKLYSLLDEDVLHSKHRSRFFRLLDAFMNSTHLPAALVASFIKRLARLSLHAPPGAIVWIVPWTYNLLTQHPSCTFMLHRPFHPAHYVYAQASKYETEGVSDPFEANEPDPMLTHAIDSSLWELHTLTQHYHPNVATLAKILSEQFTKREYQLEDFLDYNYASLVDSELEKLMKKVPVVEFEIPKRIVTLDSEKAGLNEVGLLLNDAIQAL